MIRTVTIFGFLLTSLLAQYPAEWVINPPDYEHTMTVTAIVELNGEATASAEDALAVFYDGECRGVSEPILVGELYMHFLMVYSNDQNLELNFKAWDNTVGNVVDLEQNLSFESGAAVGTVGEPHLFTGTNPISYLEAFDDYVSQVEDEAGPGINPVLNDIVHDTVAVNLELIQGVSNGFLEFTYPYVYHYSPLENFFGLDSFQYSISTAFATDTAWVHIEVTAVNDPPSDFGLISPADETYMVDVDLTEATFSWELPVDVENDPLTYSLYLREGVNWDTSFAPMGNELVLNIEAYPREVWLDWHVIAFDAWGWTESLDTFAIKIGDLVSIDGEAVVPNAYTLDQNYPNPFNPVTSIGFSLPETNHVNISIYNLRNQLVHNLIDGNISAGNHRVEWNSLDDTGRPITSGVYLVVMQSGNFREVRKILMLK